MDSLRKGNGLPFSVSGYKTGLYYGQQGPGAANTPNPNVLRASPVFFDRPVTADRIAFKVNTAGAAGDVVRVGIYRDAGAVYPGALLLDAGTVNVGSTGVKEATISQALDAGWWWLVIVRQGNSGTPVFEANDKALWGVGQTNLGTSPHWSGFEDTNITGALPANFTTTPASEVGIRMWVRLA